jgi:hypothetical protein
VVPGVFSVRYDRVPIGNQAIDDNPPVIAELAESHENVFDDGLGADVRSCQGKAIRLGPGNIVGEHGRNRSNISGREAFVKTADNFFIVHRKALLLLIVRKRITDVFIVECGLAKAAPGFTQNWVDSYSFEKVGAD